MYDGLHPALITEEQFMLAQEIRLKRQPSAKVKDEFVLQNAFAGLLFCGICGKRIGRTITSKSRGGIPRVRCVNGRNCHNSSADYEIVEKEIIAALRTWLKGYRVKIDTTGFADDIAEQRTEVRPFCCKKKTTGSAGGSKKRSLSMYHECLIAGGCLCPPTAAFTLNVSGCLWTHSGANAARECRADGKFHQEYFCSLKGKLRETLCHRSREGPESPLFQGFPAKFPGKLDLFTLFL